MENMFDEEYIISTVNKQIQILNEYDLHTKVVEYIRRFHPNAILVPGLGENQMNSTLRCKSYQKGYTAGQRDILILNNHIRYSGLSIEFKTPEEKKSTMSFSG